MHDYQSADIKAHLKGVEDAIVHLNACKQQIADCTLKAKQEVRIGVNQILNNVRQREIQILRQIDMSQLHYGEAFHTQNAKLHQVLGILKQTLNNIDGYNKETLVSMCPEDLRLSEEVLQKTIDTSAIIYQGDANEICKRIQKFGTITITGLLTWLADDKFESKCMPANIEEYEDAEHQLFYKTLHNLQLEKQSEQIPPNFDDWLKPSLMDISTNSINFPQNFLIEDVSFWLKDGLRESIMEEDKSSLDRSFEVVDDFNVSDPGSIELLSKSSSVSSFGNLKPTSPMLNKSVRNGCKNRRDCCTDIENLGSALCSNENFSCQDYVSKWLANEDSGRSLNNLFKNQLRMGDVCMANECCTDFDECVCKEKCVSKAFEFLDSQRSDISSSIDPCWLKTVTDRCWMKNYNWVKHDFPGFNENMFSSGEKMNWVKNTQINNYCEEKMDDCGETYKDSFVRWCKTSAKDKNIVEENVNWLSIDNSEESTDSANYIRKDFEKYFINESQSNWLNTKNN